MYKSNLDLLKKFIKLKTATPSIKATIPKLNKNNSIRAIFIGSPVHSNLGDQLIAVECLNYIKTLNFDEIIEVPEFSFEIFSSHMYLSKNDVIFVNGGGWMGDLYEDELVIEEIISKWPNNKIIILPQTVYFGSNKYSSVDQLRKILKSHANLILCVRDDRSYNLCRNLLEMEDDRCILLPDMALLALRNVKKEINKKKIVQFSLRNDAEKNSDFDINNALRTIEKHGYKFEFTSTVLNKMGIGMANREKAINDKVNEISKAELMITDRLHTMIFSLLSGTKCIAIDNLTHKVSGVASKWLDGFPGLVVCDSGTDVSSSLITNMLNSKIKPKSLDLSYQMDQLTHLI